MDSLIATSPGLRTTAPLELNVKPLESANPKGLKTEQVASHWICVLQYGSGTLWILFSEKGPESHDPSSRPQTENTDKCEHRVILQNDERAVLFVCWFVCLFACLCFSFVLFSESSRGSKLVKVFTVKDTTAESTNVFHYQEFYYVFYVLGDCLSKTDPWPI